MELVGDFRRLYGLWWWDAVEYEDPDQVHALVAGLMLYPDSLYRAAYLRDNPPMEAPPSDGRDDRIVDWFGLDQTTLMMIRLYNQNVPPGHQLRTPVLPYTSPEEANQAAIFHLLTH